MGSRTFVILAFLMGVVFVAGISFIVVQLASDSQDIDLTVMPLPAFNPTQEYRLILTQTAAASLPYDYRLYATRQQMRIDIAASLGPAEDHIWRMTETAIVATYQGTPGSLPTYTPSAAPTATPCAWMWATQPLPDLESSFQAALTELDSLADKNHDANVGASGEICVIEGGADNFTAMQTDFEVDIYGLPDTASKHDIAAMVADILTVLQDYPIDETPGPLAGQVIIDFHGDEGGNFENRRLLFNYDAGMDALNQNLTGQALLDALGGLN